MTAEKVLIHCANPSCSARIFATSNHHTRVRLACQRENWRLRALDSGGYEPMCPRCVREEP